MCQQLNEINFAQIFDRMDVQTAFDYFYDKLNSLILGNVPIVRVKKNNNKPKWWTKELQTKKNKRDKMYKRKPKNEMTEEYTEALNEFNELQDKLYNEYIKDVQENIIQNPAEFWKFAKVKQKRSKYPLEMKYNDKKADNPGEIVEMFADYFESIYAKDDVEGEYFEEIYTNEPVNAIEINLSMLDIEAAIKKLKERGRAGPENLSPIVMKKCAESLVWPLWILHQKSMELGKISSKLKISRVVPEFKKGDKNGHKKLSNNRNEIATQDKLLLIVNPHMKNVQHDFRPKRSVVSNLLNLSIAAHESFANKQQLDVFYGDFQNAFDKLVHRIFIKKAWTFRIGKKTAKWLLEFLTGRKFFVKIGIYE